MKYPLSFAAMLAVLGLLLAPQSSQADAIYYIGNSVSDAINREALVEMAASRGHTQVWGRQMIPGAPIQWLWDHPDSGFTQAPYGYPPNALPNYNWEVLSLQPFDRDLASDVDYSGRFVGLLFGGANPSNQQLWNRDNSRIFIYGRWPRQDEPANRTFDQLWLRKHPEGGSNSVESADYATDLTLAVRGSSVSGVPLSERVYMVPVGHVMYELNQQMKSGQIPGLTNIFQIYTDGIHLNNLGSYIATLTYFTVIYRESPVGLVPAARFAPNPNQPKDILITSELAATVQNTVWNVCQTQPLSGVPSQGTMLLTTSAVPSGYLNQPYSTSLLAVGGTLPRSFTLTAGTLPQGLSLATSGMISGTPGQSGNFDFTVTVTDARSPSPLSVSRAFRLRIEVDTDPEITTATILPGGNKGTRYLQQLAASGGNGQLSWSLVSGSLPAGMVLGGGGTLVGTPVQSGTYSFTVQVADGDLPADTDSATFTMQIAEPTSQTLTLAKTLSPVRIDGALVETHWTGLSTRRAAIRSLGAPNNTTAFDALWDGDNLYLAVQVLDSHLASPGTDAERDSIEIYLDAFNDKQAEFNSQHRQFRVSLDGSLFERGGRSSGVKTALVMIPGGYQLEMQVPWTNLGITPTPDGTVIGLDVVSNDADQGGGRQHAQSFAGTSATAPSPAQFGNAILSSTAVSGSGGEPFGSSAPSPALYEGFDYGNGQLLHGSSGGLGWAPGSTWEMDGGATATTYFATGSESLLYGPLGTTGIHMLGGNNWSPGGRFVDTRSGGAMADWLRGDGFIGKDGTTLWISYLVRPRLTNVDAKFSLDDGGGAVYHDNEGRVRVKQVGGKWRLSLNNDTIVQDTTVALVAETTYFMVLKLSFGATDRVELFVNPMLGPDAPTSPSASCTTTDANFKFREVQMYPGSYPDAARFDEVRIGASWDAVAPVPAQQVAPVTYSPLPGPIVANTLVTLSSATAGATIRYTTDGSEPTASSPLYTSAITLVPGASIQARAFLVDSPDSPKSGATYRNGLTIPEAPTAAAVTVLSSAGLRLNWSDRADNETGYRIERSLDGTTAWTTLVSLDAGSVEFSDYSVAAGTAYFYRILAVNSLGDSTPALATGTTWSRLEQWRFDQFGSTAGTGDGADDATPAGDGVPNLLKYALGLDPGTPSAHLLPKPVVVGDSISLSVTLVSLDSRLTASFVQSHDLLEWTIVPPERVAVSGQTWTATVPLPATSGNPLLLRFMINH